MSLFHLELLPPVEQQPDGSLPRMNGRQRQRAVSLIRKRDLRKSQLIPCKLVGGLRFNEYSKNAYDAPDMTWYLEALPITEESYTDIQLRDIPINDETIWKNMVENNARYRPDLAESQQGFITSQVLNVISTTPVTNVVYSWLKDDLKEIGWLE